MVWLSAVNTKFDCKKIFGAAKIQKQPLEVFLKRRPGTLWKRGSSIGKVLRAPILKNICELLLLKISTSVTNLPRGGNSWFFFYPFKPFSILHFPMKEWFCHGTCFVKVSLLLFFFLLSNLIFLSLKSCNIKVVIFLS